MKKDVREFRDSIPHHEACQQCIRSLPVQDIQLLAGHAEATLLPLAAEHPGPNTSCKCPHTTFTADKCGPSEES